MGNSFCNRRLCNGLFGKTRQAVLALLYGRADVSFFTRQILDAVGGGRGTVQRELENLTDAGIITREVQGRQVYYRANQKCPIFAEIRGIVRKTFGLADIVRGALAPITGKIDVSLIFGSMASGTESRSSDIDLMVIGETTFAEIASAIGPAETTLGREINPVVYPVEEFRQKVREDQNFVRRVVESDKIFIIGDESDLAGLVEQRPRQET